MNNLYSNITDKNNFYSKLTAPSALLVFLIYLLSTALIPAVSSIVNTKNNTYVNTAKQYNGLANKILVTKINNAVSNTINIATYVNNGQMLARQIDNNNLQNYVNDAKGSVLKLNSADKSQNQTYSYDAYGNIINDRPALTQKTSTITNPGITQSLDAQRNNLTSTIINPFQYNGERTDSNTALQYLRARFYNSETKRFLNQDSYDFLNRFGYVDGNPVMEIDPTGHDAADYSIWRQVMFWAAPSLAGMYGAYRLGKFILNKCRPIVDEQLTPDILKSRGSFLGKGVEGSVYEHNGQAYKVYHGSNIDPLETSAQRDAHVLNSLSVNQVARFSAEAVGVGNLILKMPVVSIVFIEKEERKAIVAKIFMENRRFFSDAHSGNFGMYTNPLNGENYPVVFDVGQTVTVGEPMTPVSKEVTSWWCLPDDAQVYTEAQKLETKSKREKFLYLRGLGFDEQVDTNRIW